MRILVLTGAFLLGSASLACAAGHDWSGAYAGVQLGYAWGSSDFTDSQYNGVPPFPTMNWDVDSNGFFGGLQTGYNWQRRSAVFGVEGEIGYLNMHGSALQPGVDPFGDPYDAAGTIDQGWYGGISARLGYAPDRTLFYTKAGAVYTSAEIGFVDSCTTPPCGNSIIHASETIGWGYQLGAGVEHALSHNWSIRTEYTYYDFGSKSIRSTAIGGGMNGTPISIDSDLSTHAVKAGLNYKF